MEFRTVVYKAIITTIIMLCMQNTAVTAEINRIGAGRPDGCTTITVGKMLQKAAG